MGLVSVQYLVRDFCEVSDFLTAQMWTLAQAQQAVASAQLARVAHARNAAEDAERRFREIHRIFPATVTVEMNAPKVRPAFQAVPLQRTSPEILH